MAPLRDLDEFFDGSFAMPVGGKVYKVPPPSVETGVLCQKIFNAGIQAAAAEEANGDAPVKAPELDDDEEIDLYRRVLGPVYGEMAADGVDWARLKHCALTAFFWIVGDRSMAERWWESSGEVQAPNRAARRAASSTKNRASGSGTTRKKTPAKRSPGGRSSSTGR